MVLFQKQNTTKMLRNVLGTDIPLLTSYKLGPSMYFGFTWNKWFLCPEENSQ